MGCGLLLLHHRSHLWMILLLIWSSSRLPCLRAESSGSASDIARRRSLDVILQDYAFRAFPHHNIKTGDIYDGTVPSNLTGMKVSGIRLRSGSLFYRGVKSYKEFEIPIGVLETPYVERLVLVYQNLGGDWSDNYYEISGYTYLSPVLGLLAYTAYNLSATNLPELDFMATMDPILIHFSDVRSVSNASAVKCVTFSSDGSMSFDKVASPNTCEARRPGHFGLVFEGTLPPAPAPAPAPAETPPAPAPAPAPASAPASKGGEVKGKKKHGRKVAIIVGSVVGGVLLLLLLGLLLLWLKRYKHRKKLQGMERSSEGGEALRMAPVGSAKAPAAVVTRTQPSLETEYVP